MTLRPTPLLRGAALLAVAAGALLTAACAPDDPGPAASSSRPSPVETESPDRTPTPTATASASPLALPTDCRAILSEAVLSQLAGTPLNDPAYGAEAGVQADGSLVCIWGDPAADVTSLTTEISFMNRGPALDMLNRLADDEDFDCYTPSAGTRCEKSETTPADAQYPDIVQGRTLFWRDDVLIDTRYSNLAPTGYTDSIVQSLFG